MRRRRPIIPPEQVHAMARDLSVEDRRFFFAGLSRDTAAAYHLWKSKLECDEPDHNIALADRALRRMNRVDAMDPHLRSVVHEHGLELVHVFLEHKVTWPSRITALIEATRERKAGLHELFRQFGVKEERSIKYLVGAILNTNIPNPNLPGGQTRFAPNKGPNSKPNPINRPAFDKSPRRP
jgi:hypothetical protein